MYDNVIFREYDIRGVYGKQFDPDFAFLLGRAMVTYISNKLNIKNPKIAVGHDARLSGPDLKLAVEKGIVASGGKVLHLGLVTTPMCYFSTFEVDGVNGSIQITGSHNPPEYNGFKVCAGTSSLFGAEIQALRKIIESGLYAQGTGSVESYDLKEKYLQRYKKEFGQLKKIPVVLDCGNGAAGSIVRDLFHTVGLEPIILFEQPDGRFPNHHPDPTVEENLVDLKNEVLKQKAVVGIGFDGDADRIGVVDHSGRMIYGDELMVIFSRAILALQKGQPIVGDVKCSDRLYHDIAKHGGQPIMWKTGHSLIKEKIKTEKAPFGGEMSGHIFFADRNYGYDDAPYAAVRLCEILSQTQKTIPELLQGLPQAYNTPEIRIDTTEEKKVLIVEKMKEAFSVPGDFKVNLTDGIRISFPQGWALCRSSNTQPVLVLRYESETAAGLQKIKEKVEDVVNKYL